MHPKPGIARRGFTLLELSVVLILIATILGSGLAMLTASLQASQYNTTVARMDAIEKALLNYGVSFYRVPCPANLTLTVASANYGYEAGASAGGVGSGECVTGMTPAANFKSVSGAEEGGVPTRALQLPDEYMYDGWGRKFRYAVDPSATKTNSLPYPTGGLCSASASSITVNDAGGGARTTSAIYALVSHGVNGHGAYTSNGVAANGGSVNGDELTNCHCDSTGAAAAYTPNYVEKVPMQDASNALDNFDDLVTFKEGWQMQAPNYPLAAAQTCNVFAAGGSIMSRPTYFYTVSNNTITGPTQNLSYASGRGGDNPSSAAFSPDNTHFYLFTGAPNGYAYPVAASHIPSTTYSQAFGYNTVGSNPLIVSSDNQFVASLNSSVIDPWQYSGGMIHPALPRSRRAAVTIFPWTRWLITSRWVLQEIARLPHRVPLYTSDQEPPFPNWRDSRTFRSLPTMPAIASGSYSHQMETISTQQTPAIRRATYLRIYSVSGDTFTYLSGQPNVQPCGSVGGVMAVSPNSKYLALSCTYGSPYIQLYKNHGDGTFTQISNPSSLPGSIQWWGVGLAFSADSKYLAILEQNSPYILIYSINSLSDTFTALSTPSPLPSAQFTFLVATH